MIEFPKIGSAPNGLAHVFSKQLKEDYARLIGVPVKEANFIIDCVGAVIHDRLLRGQPCGIPFLGVIHMKFRRGRRFHMSGVSGRPWNPEKRREMEFPVHGQPTLWMSKRVRLYIRDSAPYTGDLRSLYRKAWINEKEVIAIRKVQRAQKKAKVYLEGRTGRPRGNPQNLKNAKKERIRMSEIRKKRLMVEDANAVEVSTKKGRDEILKTADRKETVKQLKEQKEGPKPIHD
jgi:hypothetical protein